MNHWQILDIEPVADTRLVRKAYAKVLKTIDQDLEPQRFIQLRNALGRALTEIQHAEAGLSDDPPVAADDQLLVLSPDTESAAAEPLEGAPPVAEGTAEPPLDEWTAAFHAENNVYFEQYDALLESLLAHDFSDSIYQRFVANLATLPHRSLALQLWAYDGTAYALGKSCDRDDKVTWQAAERFIRHWWQVRGNELPLAEDHEYGHALYARIEQLAAEDEFWQQVPRHLRDEMRALRTESKIHYLAMARLAWSEEPFIQQYLAHNWRVYPIDNIDHSQNVVLIGYLKKLPLLWPTMLMIVIGMMMLLNLAIPIQSDHGSLHGIMANVLPADDPAPDPLVGIVLFSGFIAILWSVFFQAYITIGVMAKPAIRQLANQVAIAWLSVGLFLSVIMSVFSPLTQQGWLGGWLLVGAVIMGYTRYDRPSLFGHLHRAVMGDYDYIFTMIATFVLFGFILIEAYVLGNTAGTAPGSWILGLLPITMLLNFDYLHRVLKPILSFWLIAAVVIGLVILVLIAQSDSVASAIGAVQEVLGPLSLTAFLIVMGLPLLIPPAKLPYALKYGTYLTLILLPIYFHVAVLGGFGALMLFCTARHDWQQWRFPKDAIRVKT